MKFEDLKKLYLEKKEQFGTEAYKHISELFEEAEEIHKQDWLKDKDPTQDGAERQVTFEIEINSKEDKVRMNVRRK